MSDALPTVVQAEPPTPLSFAGMVLAFLRLGAIGFGGGMAVFALMEEEFVRRRRVLALEEFLHGMALGQVLGSFAVNLAFFIGHRLRGILGALAAVTAFLAPSVTMVILLSWLYFRYHALPALQGVLAGLGPVVIALILSAAWSMGRKTLRRWPAVAIALGAALAGTLKVNSVSILGTAGLLGLILGSVGRSPSRKYPELETKPVADAKLPAVLLVPGTASVALGMGAVSWALLAVTFLHMGLLFFGGGFVLVPVLYQKLVAQLHWLSPQEFLDGVAISNLTPGPIAVLATFAGYRVRGVFGALVATAALFAPGLILQGILGTGYERFRESMRLQAFLSGLTPAVVGLVVAAALILGPSALPSWRAVALLILALLLLVRFRWHPAFVLALGGVVSLGGLVR